MEEGLKEHQRNLSDLVFSHVIPKHAIIDSAVGATLISENKIIASCRIFPQVCESIYFRGGTLNSFQNDFKTNKKN